MHAFPFHAMNREGFPVHGLLTDVLPASDLIVHGPTYNDKFRQSYFWLQAFSIRSFPTAIPQLSYSLQSPSVISSGALFLYQYDEPSANRRLGIHVRPHAFTDISAPDLCYTSSGGTLLSHLLTEIPSEGLKVFALVRTPAQAESVAVLGVQPLNPNFDDEEQLKNAIIENSSKFLTIGVGSEDN